MKRVLLLLGAAAVLAGPPVFACTGCSEDTWVPEQSYDIDVMDYWDSMGIETTEAINAADQQFMAQNPNVSIERHRAPAES